MFRLSWVSFLIAILPAAAFVSNNQENLARAPLSPLSAAYSEWSPTDYWQTMQDATVDHYWSAKIMIASLLNPGSNPTLSLGPSKKERRTQHQVWWDEMSASLAETFPIFPTLAQLFQKIHSPDPPRPLARQGDWADQGCESFERVGPG